MKSLFQTALAETPRNPKRWRTIDRISKAVVKTGEDETLDAVNQRSLAEFRNSWYANKLNPRPSGASSLASLVKRA